MTLAIPKVDAYQAMPTALEKRALEEPNGVFTKIPRSTSSYKPGFRSVTNPEMLNAVDRLAWIFERDLGKGLNFEAIAYIGPTDLRYWIVVLAAIKTGYKTFLPSPGNSMIAFESLFSVLQCNILVTTDPQLAIVSTILEKCNLRKFVIPSLQDLLDDAPVPPYPYGKTFEERKAEPAFVLHTSGSTGIPKPLIYPHQFVSANALCTTLTPPSGWQSVCRYYQHGSFFNILPPFHAAGICFGLLMAMYNRFVPAFPLPGAPPTIQSLIEAANTGDLDWALCSPAMIDQLGKDPTSLEIVAKKLQHLLYGGGAVPKASGNTVAARLPLCQALGSSECGVLGLIQPDNTDLRTEWDYFNIDPAVGAEFQHRYEELYELVIVKDTAKEYNQPVFYHFPTLQQYETTDLYSEHPTKPGLWRHAGRIDDIIVFLNGKKTNPVSFEHEVARHPEIRSALVVGEQREEASVIIELNDTRPMSPEEVIQKIERIWPTIQEANTRCPAHAKVAKSRILIVDPKMPILRTSKGTMQRKATLNLYADKLDSLYSNSDMDLTNALPETFDYTDQTAIANVIQQTVTEVTDWPSINNSDEFFNLGMNSLEVIQLSRTLKIKFRLSALEPRVVYANPSVKLLSRFIMDRSNWTQDYSDCGNASREEQLRDTIQHYEERIERLDTKINNSTSVRQNAGTSRHGQVVVLTGSTGSLGSFILEELIRNEATEHIYCFNRAKDSQTLQIDRNKLRDLSTTFSSSKVTFLTVDFQKVAFGLDKQILHQVLSEVTQIIHNAWPVNFNRSLKSFYPTLDGLYNLISLAHSSRLRASLFFLSSIGAVANYHQTNGFEKLVPERIIKDLNCPGFLGYAESKYVAERMLDNASRKFDIPIAILRIGQIAGTYKNPRAWNRWEWLPSLVVSSKYLSCLPSSLGISDSPNPSSGLNSVDWIPVDELSKVIVELGSNFHQTETNSRPQVYHAVNPQSLTWSNILPVVQAKLQTMVQEDKNAASTEMRIISLPEWLEILKQSSTQQVNGREINLNEQMVRHNPAIKLLDFYLAMLVPSEQITVSLDTEKTQRLSASLRDMKPIQADMMIGWIDDWFRNEKE